MSFESFKKKLFPNFDNDPYDDGMEDPADEEENAAAENVPARSAGSDRQENYPARSRSVAVASRSSAVEMKVVNPTRFESATSIADLLRDNVTVLLNLEKTNKEVSRRLIDFLSGVAYTLDGDVKKVAENTFAITPSNVNVSNDAFEAAKAEEAPADTTETY